MKKTIFFVLILLLSACVPVSSAAPTPPPITETSTQIAPANTRTLLPISGRIFVNDAGTRSLLFEADKTTDMYSESDLATFISPDGNNLAYFSTHYAVINLTTKQKSIMDFEYGGDPNIAWSPDGKHIVFGCWTNDGGMDGLCIADIKSGTTSARYIYGNPNADIEVGNWSATGNLIVFSVRVLPEAGGRAKGIIVTLNVETGEVKTLFDESAQSMLLSVSLPNISTDGNKVLFQGKLNGTSQIFSMTSDGLDVKQITHEIGYDTTRPIFSPDGRFFVAYTGAPTIFSLDGKIILKLKSSGVAVNWIK